LSKEKDNKEKSITIRLEPELKTKFQEKCNKLAINQSAWLRMQIEKFVNEK